jgi:hypothetical protein
MRQASGCQALIERLLASSRPVRLSNCCQLAFHSFTEVLQRVPARMTPIQQLQAIEPLLAGLRLGYEILGSTQALGKVNLRQPRCNPIRP